MIVRDRPGLLRLFFILRGSIILRILPQVLVILALSMLVVWVRGSHPGWAPAFNGAPFALLGIALSVFLGFRNNACYDRWWEARKDWGQLLTTVRDLGRQTLILERDGQGEREPRAARRQLLRLAMAFGHACVCHLRPGGDLTKPRRFLSASQLAGFEASRNRPDYLLRQMGQVLADLLAGGHLSDIQYGVLDGTLGRLSAVLAACERIRNTPVPFAYTLLLHRTAYLFCFLLPFGFADVLHWGTPVITALVAYTFFGLDALGDELEDPFGTQANALPIEALADTIEINLREALGETDLPPLPQPNRHVLM
ncbi:bestrophin family protein [Nitrospirillum sp. BR 11828]|uniref:bestrophin family protein n=1 Tax=Nitrospirillum sp. BR 11828 TaxID=3104325 RepID=UPI002ACAFAA0|nr:bestrophin family protein [Nitrospirillum sp. BR 11828]MDZ5647708.1 bestrophin family protein [Nitrospirillum sp. BR 11828]